MTFSNLHELLVWVLKWDYYYALKSKDNLIWFKFGAKLNLALYYFTNCQGSVSLFLPVNYNKYHLISLFLNAIGNIKIFNSGIKLSWKIKILI